MKKNVLLLVCAVLLSMGHTFAANVNVQQARAVALNFFKIKLGNVHTAGIAATLQYTRTEADNTVDFYVFNMSPVKGFVIVSATDNDEPVIGYSTESVFASDFSKIGLNEWLNRWTTELHYVIHNNVIATPLAASHWAAYRQGVAPASVKAGTVGPLCQTNWDQYNETATTPALYNNYCPGTGTNQAVTGCVATTMSQIMRYWKYPVKGTGSSSYNDATSQGYQTDYGTLSFNYGTTTFDWANMPAPGLTNSSTTAQINAVGTLMSATGISVEMDYSPNGSGAAVLTSQSGGYACAQKSYVQYFGYQNIIEGLLLNSPYTSAQLLDSIYADLNAGRLVQVQGTDQTSGGHTWVCDGYDATGKLHMNWGWSGYSNGYFALTTLNPSNGGSTPLNFNQNVGVLTHIQPPVTTTISELASATTSSICAGASTSLHATTHTGATYSWTPTTGLSSSTVAAPVASPTTTTTYTVTADSAGIRASSSVTVTVNQVPLASLAATNTTCFGSSNGSVAATVSSGTAGYTYVWSNGQTTATASNLAQGTYNLTVTDSKSCTTTATKTVTQPASALSVTTTPVNATCGQPNGSITAVAAGGTSGYTYHWSNNATTSILTNISGGNYTLTITDAHSCSTTTSASITSSGTLSLATNAVNVSCNGAFTGSASAAVTGSVGSVTYHWSNGATTSSIQNVQAATYIVTITDGSGCSATSSKTISQPAIISNTISVVNAGCGMSNGSATASVTGGAGGYSYLWSNGSTSAADNNIPAGTYTITVTDANHCSMITAAVISAGTTLSASITSHNVTCYNENNGDGQISLTSGTAPYAYNWSNGATTSSLTNLAPGSYSVTITDVNHCTASGHISISQPNQIQVSTNSTGATGGQDNGTATVAGVVGATAPYTYQWSNGGTTQSISNLAANTYTVTVTDANGCTQTAADVVNGVATGVNAISNEVVFSMYPNPAHNQVLVQVDHLNKPTVINVRNILGQSVIAQSISTSETQLDLSTLANGVYIVELRQGDKVAVKQLVVTK